jgi:hypothetical protein
MVARLGYGLEINYCMISRFDYDLETIFCMISRFGFGLEITFVCALAFVLVKQDKICIGFVLLIEA